MPALQVAPDVTVRADGTFSDPAYPDDAVVVRIHRVEDALVVDLFYNRFLSNRGAPALEERVEPAAPGQTREVELGDGRCRTERLVEITTYEKTYCEVTCRWERWVLPAESAGLIEAFAPLEADVGADAASQPAGIGRVVSIQAAAGAGALDTSTDMTFGDEPGEFLLGSESTVEALKAAGRKVADGWTPVGFWYESRESTSVPPREEWQSVGDPFPCKKKPVPLPPGDDDAVAVPGGDQLEPAGHGRNWLWALIAFILLLLLLWVFVFPRPETEPLAEDDGEQIAEPAPTTAETVAAEPTEDPAVAEPSPTPTSTPEPTPTPEQCVEVTPLDEPGTALVVTADEPGLIGPAVPADGDPAGGLEVSAGWLKVADSDSPEPVDRYVVQYHFFDGVPATGGHPAMVGGEIDPQLAAGGHTDGPDIKIAGKDTPPHLDLHPVVLPDPAAVLAERGLPPTTPHSIVIVLNPEVFDGADEASIWFNHEQGFNHNPQAVTAPPDPAPAFDPSVFGRHAWLAAALERGQVSQVATMPQLNLAAMLLFDESPFTGRNCGS